MKRHVSFLFALIWCLCLLISAACEADFSLDCTCGLEKCSCFLQEGDRGSAVRGVIARLKEEGLLSKSHVVERFDEEVTLAVRAFQTAHGLPPTGTLDDMTLTLLLWGLTPSELTLANPGSNPNPVWIPTDGGIRRHRIPACCGMNDPRKVSVRNAEALGMEPCGVCRPE